MRFTQSAPQYKFGRAIVSVRVCGRTACPNLRLFCQNARNRAGFHARTTNGDDIAAALESLPPDQGFKVALALLKKEKEDCMKKEERIQELLKQKDEVNKELMKQKDEVNKELLKQKDEQVQLVTRLSRAERLLTTAMHSDGVTNARSMLDYIQDKKGYRAVRKPVAWAHLLAASDGLLQCILTGNPEWERSVHHLPKDKQLSVIASKIAAVHGQLSNDIHNFVPGVGLRIYEGIPNMAMTSLLRCIARYYSIPYLKVPYLTTEAPSDISGDSV